MISGGGETKTLRLVARYADSCNIVGSLAEITAKLDIPRAHCETEGRDCSTITPTVMSVKDPFDDLPAFLAGMEAYADPGVKVVDLIPRASPVDCRRPRRGRDRGRC